MKKILFVLLIVLLSTHIVLAQERELIGDGYVICDINCSLASQKKVAIDRAKTDVINKAGYYIRSYSKLNKNIITDDDIYVISNDITRIAAIDLTEEVDINGVKVLHATVHAVVDDDYLEKIRKKDINAIIKKYSDLNEKYSELKCEYEAVISQIKLYDLYMMGVKYQNEKKYTDAETFYKEALSVKPHFKEAHIGLGNVYFANNDYLNALKEYELVLNVDNRNIAAHYGKAKTYAELNKYRESLIEYNIVLTLNSKFINGYIGRAAVYHQLGKLTQENDDKEMIKMLNNENGGILS